MYDTITSATTSATPLPPQPVAGQKRKRARTLSTNILPTPQPKHPYLSGNFAPIQQTLPLTKCTYTGTIPPELADGEYVRNGSNPVSNEDLGRDAHWFDGDGMLAGVLFRSTGGEEDGQESTIEPEFVNQFILTDLYLSTLSSPRLKVPILMSIATLVSPVANMFYVALRILRTVLLVILSHLPGSLQKIKKISVANTSIVYHDGRAMALCESGPPMRIQLPELETVGWYNGAEAEGEPEKEKNGAAEEEKTLGQDGGLISFMREWTTAHPKVDPKTKEMLMFHSSFAPPYVQYSIIPQESSRTAAAGNGLSKVLNAPVPDIHGAKMMHDFGVSSTHTVIMDLPLTLDPVNQLKGLPPVNFDSSRPSRFGVFPRRQPENVRYFETDASCIFHTANTWDTVSPSTGQTTAVNMLACRLTSATMVFAAGNIAPPVQAPPKTVAAAREKRRRMPFFSKYNDSDNASSYETSPLLESPDEEKEAFLSLSPATSHPQQEGDDDEEIEDFLFEEDQCRLYYYAFDLARGAIAHQWALSAIPFEFPSVHPQLEMQDARYVYGCSTTTTSFGSALGKATKIDALVKVDVRTLIARGRERPPRSVSGIVDQRSMAQILEARDADPSNQAEGRDPISVFTMPEGWFAQEPRFVPSRSAGAEDDGFLLFYAFDESQLSASGDVPDDAGEGRAKSELWVVDAKGMRDVVCRVHLPQRVPYGLHGGWFDAQQIGQQRPVEAVRNTGRALSGKGRGLWMGVRDAVERFLA